MSDVPKEFGGDGDAAAAMPASPAPQPAPANLPVKADRSILRDIETASETMAMYTAIIGKPPLIIDPSAVDSTDGDAPPPLLTISPSWPQVNRMVIGIWFRRMSDSARKRIDQAVERLAG